MDPQPSWVGYSTGKWEGDTLVVQTSGFRDGLWLDANGSPLTESAKITERIRRVNFGKLEIEITVDDPKAYTSPWTVKLTQLLKRRYGSAGLLLQSRMRRTVRISRK